MKKTIRKYLKDIRTYIQLLLAGISVWFIVRFVLFGMLTGMQYVAVFFGLTAVNLFVYFLMFVPRKRSKNRLRKALGKGLGVALCVFLALVSTGMTLVDSFLGAMTDTLTVTRDISYIVMEEGPVQSAGDIQASMTAGVQKLVSEEDREKVLEEIEKEGGERPHLEEYESLQSQIDALYAGEVDAVIISESYRDIIEDEKEDFSSRTRVVLSLTMTERQANISKKKDVTEDPFLVLITGMDTYGSLETTARSDVNILAAVNPSSAKILLVSIPRDYYVPIMAGSTSIAAQDGSMDKLTHSGLFGPECTVRTLENYFDLEINYYVKVNFSSLVDIVDAVGGITVESDQAFGNFQQGANQLDGEGALAFSRERYAFQDGDRQRGRNQMKLIEAIVAKLSDPSLNYDYGALFQTVSQSIGMNFSDIEVKELIQFELTRRPAWQVESISVTGTDGEDYSYFYGADLYVMYPDAASVETAKEKIAQVMDTGANGEIKE